MSKQGLRPPQIDIIVLRGGMDQITPTMSLAGGVVRDAVNFECGVTGGYTRIAGYERFDGHASPSESAANYRVIVVDSMSAVPMFGDILTSSGGATGAVAYVEDNSVVVSKIIGTFEVGETVSVSGGTVGAITDATGSVETPYSLTVAKAAIADLYRADIEPVPGSGPVRGVIEFNDVVYAFRNNTLGTAVDIYKSTTSGWAKVDLLYSVDFTAGGATTPSEGTTLSKSGVTATVKRVVLRSGAWATNTAAGTLIISAPTGGNFSSGVAAIGGVSVTLSGAQSAVTLPAGGTYEFAVWNFYGQASTTRIYGCNGVGAGFEFDGTILVPIITGATSDIPAHVACHKNYLWFSIGSSVMYSGPGLPYEWSALAGAGEIATGDTVSGMVVMPGGTSTATLGISSRNNFSILYGSSPDDFNFVQFNTGTGAVPYSLQNMAQTLAFDDRGAISIQAALQYGNFDQTTLTNQVLPFINSKINTLTTTTLCRRKSQYRLFFSDGYGLYISLVNGKLIGCMPVSFPMIANCSYEGKKNDGTDLMFIGATNGYVYQLDKGTSFDGEEINFSLSLTFSSTKSPRTLKRYRKAAIELYGEAPSYAEFNFSYMLGYDSIEYSQPSTDGYSSYLQDGRWDKITWDNFFYDISSTGPIECPLDGTAENIAMYFSGSSAIAAQFTINSILIHYSLRRMMR